MAIKGELESEIPFLSLIHILEAVFAKGDRRLGAVLLEAFRRGCYFDSWEEHFHFDIWLQVFRDMGVDPAFYANRALSADETLPWDHLDYGVTKQYLCLLYTSRCV